MSMNGERRLELERARAEAIRLDLVREECRALADACDATLQGVRDIAVQQLASTELATVASEIRQIRNAIANAPDASRAALVGVSRRLHEVIARAEAGARRWEAEQAVAVAAARHAHAVACSTAPADGEAVALGRRAIEEATRGDIAETAALTASSHRASDEARAATHDERIRREVVKALVRTLKGMGFVIVGPRLDGRVVVLEGRLASGRRACFDVDLEGGLRFDLDGYEGRACASDLEKVETVMRDEFGVKLGPPQIVWKNPDRISKGARDAPVGTARKA